MTQRITFRHEPHRERRFHCYIQQDLDLCMRILCCGKPFTKQLSSDSLGIVDVFSGRYQATHVPPRDRCIATAIHARISYEKNSEVIKSRKCAGHILWFLH
jgi:hypothetical protein